MFFQESGSEEETIEENDELITFEQFLGISATNNRQKRQN